MEEGGDIGRDRAAATLLPRGGRWNALLNAISTWANGVELDRLSVQDHARYADSGINWRVLEGYGSLIAAYGAAGAGKGRPPPGGDDHRAPPPTHRPPPRRPPARPPPPRP